jgi:PAS domain S-box-containing protein
LVQLANQASVGIRNAKLIDELTFVRQYLEELLEHANALIVVTNRDRSVRVFNQAFAALTGLAKDEVLGRDLLELIPDAEHPRVLGVLADALQGTRANFETVVRAPGGREVRVALATSGSVNPQGEVEGIIAIGQDLTALRDLESRVVQAEKLSSLGKLAASVAHEINNPMTAVAAYVESLLDRAQANLPPPPDEIEKLRRIRENSERILRFTHDLVSYVRPAADRPQEFLLHPTLDVAVSFCGHVLEQSGVRLDREYGVVPPLLGVPGHLVQVFVNLITNACQAMQAGGRVRLTTGVEERWAVIRVEDVGEGIDPVHLERIFEPFFTTKPAGKGTGLGLSIVHGILERHGGRVEVQSTAGSGTVFTVRLPLLSASL